VFGDVAVRHPPAGICDRQQNVHGFAGQDEDGVLPYKVLVDLAVGREDEEQ
jgi:hypothetical protein